MTSAQIRQSFLDFFKSKGHTIVPPSSLLPDSPNLLFTNAGMNQFVPIFLGQRAPDVSKWPGAIPGSDTRAADTQKCIRAGGKHNDLEDVGLDTYHLTFFEMLGNWSFGDYFKKESLNWGWELLTKVWGIPPKRLFATVYSPDKSKGDPADFDQEASDIWTEIFQKEGLDPKVHIVHGNKKDNFWMMGDTGPCGPCSEIHFNLLPSDDEEPARALVNAGSQRCIEIWNHVFIQFNANPDGTYSPLPAKHVDTGMGFDRIAGFYAGTKGFKDYTNLPSAYDTDIFTTLFTKLEKLSGKKYTGTLPKPGSTGDTDHEKTDIAFRVIADHIRTLSFAIADGIQPGNTDRNYVLRRILRRAVRYGRSLGFHEPFFYKLVSVVADTMGHVFPEMRAKQTHVEEVIQGEEEAFNKTLDNGLEKFEFFASAFSADKKSFSTRYQDLKSAQTWPARARKGFTLAELNLGSRFQRIVTSVTRFAKQRWDAERLDRPFDAEDGAFWKHNEDAVEWEQDILKSCGIEPNRDFGRVTVSELADDRANEFWKAFVTHIKDLPQQFPGKAAFTLYDTYGFPVDLTELLARERGFSVDVAGFESLMREQRTRARSAQKKEIISVDELPSSLRTEFVGYEQLEATAKVVALGKLNDRPYMIFDRSPLYAEMGGQVGDTGVFEALGGVWNISATLKRGDVWVHLVSEPDVPSLHSEGSLAVRRARREGIQRHHTVTHLLHWALHEVVSKDASQKGSYVGPEKLTFDFNCTPLTPQQVADVEKLVNERILENAGVSWTEVPYSEVKARKDIMQFFGEKYGDKVRVVQIGGKPTALDGYSMELCGGTHTRATGEIGLFRIVAESAIAAGVRRIEAVAGLEAYRQANEQLHLIKSVAGKVNASVTELEKKIEALLAQQKELEKQLKSAQQKQAAETARSLIAKAQDVGSARAIIEDVGPADGDYLQSIADALKSQFKGVIVLGGASNGAVSLIAAVSPELTKQFQAGKIIQTIAPIIGGKGGGKPDNARGGGKDVAKLDEALAKARTLL